MRPDAVGMLGSGPPIYDSLLLTCRDTDCGRTPELERSAILEEDCKCRQQASVTSVRSARDRHKGRHAVAQHPQGQVLTLNADDIAIVIDEA